MPAVRALTGPRLTETVAPECTITQTLGMDRRRSSHLSRPALTITRQPCGGKQVVREEAFHHPVVLPSFPERIILHPWPTHCSSTNRALHLLHHHMLCSATSPSHAILLTSSPGFCRHSPESRKPSRRSIQMRKTKSIKIMYTR